MAHELLSTFSNPIKGQRVRQQKVHIAKIASSRYNGNPSGG